MFKGPTLATFMIDQSSQQLITSFPFHGINSCVAFISTVQQDSFCPFLIIFILLLLSLFEGGVANFVPQSKRSHKRDIMSVKNQSQKKPVGALALPTGKFLRVRKVFARIYTKWAQNQVKT